MLQKKLFFCVFCFFVACLGCAKQYECYGFGDCYKPTVPCAAPQADSGVLYSWVQMGANSTKMIARAVTESDKCPFLRLGQRCQRMELRAPRTDSFSNTVCEAPIERGPSYVEIAEYGHRIPKEQGSQVAMLGNTGCDDRQQSCNRVQSWPLSTIARSIRDQNPGLVVHLGNLTARSKNKDTWEAWREDFFEPMRELSADTLWLFVRGEQENCSNSYQGWFRFFDPFEMPSVCTLVTKSYGVRYAGMDFLVLDSSMAVDKNPGEEVVKSLEGELQLLYHIADEGEWKAPWVLTNRLVWGCEPGSVVSAVCTDVGNTMQQVLKAAPLSERIFQFVSAQLRFFSIASFEDSGPLQLMVGNGGSAKGNTYPLSGNLGNFSSGDRKTRSVEQTNQYGYAMVQPSKSSQTSFSLLLFRADGTQDSRYTLFKQSTEPPQFRFRKESK